MKDEILLAMVLITILALAGTAASYLGVDAGKLAFIGMAMTGIGALARGAIKDKTKE